jgi:nitrous oxidase accessory protein NosD
MERKLHATLLLAGLLCVAACLPARAADVQDNCAHTVESLPATLDAQGTWCLARDLSTNAASGIAINVANNNVTLDCNGHAIDGTAGAATAAIAVNANGRRATTIRNCRIRGFRYGINLDGNTGANLVEDNVLEANTWVGIGSEGSGDIVRRNRVLDTGASTTAEARNPTAIYVLGSVLVQDNMISGVVAPVGTNGYAYGIYVRQSEDASVLGNRVKGLVPDGTGWADGILLYSGSGGSIGRVNVHGNAVFGQGLANEIGIWCTPDNQASVAGNAIVGWGHSAIDGCAYDDGDNARP